MHSASSIRYYEPPLTLAEVMRANAARRPGKDAHRTFLFTPTTRVRLHHIAKDLRSSGSAATAGRLESRVVKLLARPIRQ